MGRLEKEQSKKKYFFPNPFYNPLRLPVCQCLFSKRELNHQAQFFLKIKFFKIMKSQLRLHLVVALATVCLFQSCIKDTCEEEVTYTKVTPIYMTKEAIRLGSVANELPKDLCRPGKIYYYNQHIFINENGEGVHVLDNAAPENPIPVAFISIPGNDDIAIKDGILYANNYMDLLTIDISDFQNATVISRTEDVFTPIWEDLESGQVLVEYEEELVTEIWDCNQQSTLRTWSGGFFAMDDAAFVSPEISDLSFESAQGSNTGIGGSMARFAIISNHLYVVEESEMDVISLANPQQPAYLSSVSLGWGIETIFPHEDKLFIGSNSGMFIYDNSNPAEPTLLGEFQHARACDPVFVSGDYAYVTLRDGNECQGFVNQLDLVDISDLSNPKLERTFPMDNPHGLTIRGDRLILCEGEFGLKVFDISNPLTLDQNLIAHEKDFHAFDAISLPTTVPVAIVIGEDGFFQYLLDDNDELNQLSKIEAHCIR